MGGVFRALSHPVVKAPAISLPYHWPGHSKAQGPHPQPHRVCVCLWQPPLCQALLGLPGGYIREVTDARTCTRTEALGKRPHPPTPPFLYNRACAEGAPVHLCVMDVCTGDGVTMHVCVPVCLCPAPLIQEGGNPLPGQIRIKGTQGHKDRVTQRSRSTQAQPQTGTCTTRTSLTGQGLPLVRVHTR